MLVIGCMAEAFGQVPRTATATASVENGVLKGITITDSGSGYYVGLRPSIQIIGGGGTGAVATASVGYAGLKWEQVDSITVHYAGSGYTSAPKVFIESPAEVEDRKQLYARQPALALTKAEAERQEVQEAQHKQETLSKTRAVEMQTVAREADDQTERVRTRAQMVKQWAAVISIILAGIAVIWLCHKRGLFKPAGESIERWRRIIVVTVLITVGLVFLNPAYEAVQRWSSEREGTQKSGTSTSNRASPIQYKTDTQVIRDYFRAKFPYAKIASIDGGHAGGASEVLMDFEENGLRRFVVYVSAGRVTSVKAVE